MTLRGHDNHGIITEEKKTCKVLVYKCGFPDCQFENRKPSRTEKHSRNKHPNSEIRLKTELVDRDLVLIECDFERCKYINTDMAEVNKHYKVHRGQSGRNLLLPPGSHSRDQVSNHGASSGGRLLPPPGSHSRDQVPPFNYYDNSQVPRGQESSGSQRNSGSQRDSATQRGSQGNATNRSITHPRHPTHSTGISHINKPDMEQRDYYGNSQVRRDRESSGSQRDSATRTRGESSYYNNWQFSHTGTFYCFDPDCSQQFPTSNDLDNHLTEVHMNDDIESRNGSGAGPASSRGPASGSGQDPHSVQAPSSGQPYQGTYGAGQNYGPHGAGRSYQPREDYQDQGSGSGQAPYRQVRGRR